MDKAGHNVQKVKENFFQCKWKEWAFIYIVDSVWN